ERGEVEAAPAEAEAEVIRQAAEVREQSRPLAQLVERCGQRVARPLEPLVAAAERGQLVPGQLGGAAGAQVGGRRGVAGRERSRVGEGERVRRGRRHGDVGYAERAAQGAGHPLVLARIRGAQLVSDLGCGFSKLCRRISLNSVASWGIWNLRYGLPPT